MHEGHRKRILERAKTNAGGLQGHELLEILLFNVIPRSNTNPLAHALIDKLGGLDGVFSASYEELLAVPGVGESSAAYLKVVAEVISRCHITEEVPAYAENTETFGNYLVHHFRGCCAEHIEIYCVNNKGAVTHVQKFDGGMFSASVKPEDLGLTILPHRPHGVLIAHNHPSGAPEPSAEDDVFTKQVLLFCIMNNIRILDHIVVGGGKIFSYRDSGRLDGFRETVDIKKIIRGDS